MRSGTIGRDVCVLDPHWSSFFRSVTIGRGVCVLDPHWSEIPARSPWVETKSSASEERASENFHKNKLTDYYRIGSRSLIIFSKILVLPHLYIPRLFSTAALPNFPF